MKAFVFAFLLIFGSAGWAASDTSESQVDGPTQAAGSTAEVKAWPVSYNEQNAFTLYKGVGNKPAQVRAADASKALAAAIESASATSADVSVKLNPDSATLLVRGSVVMALYPEDAVAAGFPTLSDYSEHLRTVLQDFVTRQIRRGKLQSVFLRIFLCVFFVLLGFLAIRQLSRMFNQMDHLLDEKRGSLRSVAIMSETLVSGEALGGLLAFGLAIGRISAFIAVFLAAVAAVLGQFDFTRRLMMNSAANGASQAFAGIENFVRYLPQLLLAAFLIIGLQVGLRVLDLFLKGVSSGRIGWRSLTVEKIPIARVLGTFILLVLISPLIVGSLFGSFGTPFESLILVVAAAVALSAVPIGASYVVSIFLLWKSQLKPGDWIECGPYHGEISKIGLNDLLIVPLDGGALSVPMLMLLVKPLHIRHEAPKIRLQFDLKVKASVKETIYAAEQLFEKPMPPTVDIRHLGSEQVQVIVSLAALKVSSRESLMNVVVEAMDSGKLEVLHCQFI